MNIESKINVHQSSLVGLKAELLRKKSEVEEAKASQQNVQYLNKQREKINRKSQKEQKKEERRKRREEKEERDEDPETMKAHKKSQLMLQAKSRLYSQLSKSHTTINPNFLVDFENKPDWSDHSDEEDRCKDNEKDDDDYASDYDDSDSEWVEYTDCFGRSRKCLREDLPKMREKDDDLRKTIVEVPPKRAKEQVQFFEDREPMKEPTIDVMRRKWEEQTAKLANKADIHYQDILFDEARSHGVGYFAFSQDEEERAKQQESLVKLRKETERKQQENQRILEMKEKIQQNRLKAARIRQRLRAGLPLEDAEEDKTENSNEASNQEDNGKKESVVESVEAQKEKENDESSKNVDSKESSQDEVARKKLEVIEDKVKAFGELLGKRNKWYVMSQDEWVQKKRKERIDEFAPTYKNFEQGETLNSNRSLKDSTNICESLNKDSDVIDHKAPNQNKSSVMEPAPQLFSVESFDRSVPPPLNINFTGPMLLSTDYIGPAPPTLTEECYIGPVPPPLEAFREPVPPLLPNEDFIGPVPPSSDNCIGPVSPPAPIDIPQISKDLVSNVNVEDQIAAGLKFLRQQFESKHRKR
ncbi:coiled-coil domain-containing protein 174 [Copidosoma floridanum]|uniref:coiled-coil domain-containing protein 174 n=1 Tax=Copidosoma floridanum TaxID=29053 RepID=UPI0006C9D3B9|nr:coiled-coil domain-containing protein 174 [Copidosoma floridanum]